jgi:hypothetical protein
MSKAKTLSTNKLIHSIKLRAALPETLTSFKEEDFLYFINEEIDLGVVPHVTSFHEDYFLHTEDIATVQDQMSYDIPHRALGNKLRDITYEAGGQLFEMTRISVEDQAENINRFSDNYSYKHFYISGSEIVIPRSLANTQAKLKVSYYMRPNTIVSEDNVSVVTKINRNNGLVSVDKFPEVFLNETIFDITSSKPAFKLVSIETSPEGVATDTNLNFTFGTVKSVEVTMPTFSSVLGSSYVQIIDNSESTSSIDVFWFNKTGTDIAPVVANANYYEVNISTSVTITDIINSLGNVVNSSYSNNRLILVPSTTTFQLLNGGVGISVGDNFEVSSSGFTTAQVVLTPGSVTIPQKLNINDIIALPEETIIPQVPIELHSMLAQRVAMRCLESLGDGTGLQLAAAKLADMETKTGMLIDNRVESSPLKIRPRHTPIRRSSQPYRRG